MNEYINIYMNYIILYDYIAPCIFRDMLAYMNMINMCL